MEDKKTPLRIWVNSYGEVTGPPSFIVKISSEKLRDLEYAIWFNEKYRVEYLPLLERLGRERALKYCWTELNWRVRERRVFKKSIINPYHRHLE